MEQNPIEITHQIWSEKEIPIVSIYCLTYNHEKFIRDTIESFLMQKTTFPVEILIHDDASSDNTANIIREYEFKYSNIIKPIYQTENKYSTQKGYITQIQNKRAKGTYIAKCEGDDYWTDPLKLQKQVDFLEANPDYGMVHTDYNILYQNTGIISHRKKTNIPTGDVYADFLFNSFIGTATCVFRREYIDEITRLYKDNQSNWRAGDRVLWLLISSKSRVGYINETTTIYRRNDNSITSFKTLEQEIEFFKSSYDTRFYFIHNVRKVSSEIEKKLYQKYYKQLLNYYYKLEDVNNATKVYHELEKYGRTKKDHLLYFSTKYPLLKLILKKVIG
jgi:glycosyltransferase involved in cell wall biosynthesis